MKSLLLLRSAAVATVCFASAGALRAGEPGVPPSPEPAAGGSGDWCDWLSSKPGTLHRAPDHPVLSEFRLFGRFQWQAAYLDGEDVNGYEFGDSYTDVRRFRLGAAAEFLRFFSLKTNVNLADDSRHDAGGGDLDWGYQDFDESYAGFDLREAFSIGAVDSLELVYGRTKFELGSEARESSKEIMAVERSAIANKVYGSYRPTTLALSGSRGPWEFRTALYSTDDAGDWIGGWNDGLAYFAGIGYAPDERWEFHADFLYNDAEATRGEDSLFGYEWAGSLSALYDGGRWGLHTDVYLGDNGDLDNGAGPGRDGTFWGAVVQPYYWIVEDKLQVVGRYQYAGASEDEGLRANSRYLRRDHGPVADVNGGRGDEHHSLYAGLNYLICGHNLKLMTGVEYDRLSAPAAGTEEHFDATTFWFAGRGFF